MKYSPVTKPLEKLDITWRSVWMGARRGKQFLQIL